MTTAELLADLCDLEPGHDRFAVLLYTKLFLRYLADHVYEAELGNGMALRDLTDVKQWLQELDRFAVLLYTKLFLRYLADHVYEAELGNGMALRDLTDVKQWLQELAGAVKLADFSRSTEVSKPAELRPGSKVMPPRAQSRWEECPRCGHVHEGSGECGMSMGKDRICHCDVERVK